MKLIAALALLGLMAEEHVNAHLVAVSVPEDEVVLQLFEREDVEATPAKATVKKAPIVKKVAKNVRKLVSTKGKKEVNNSDGYKQVSSEYDDMYKREEKANGYG